MVLQDVDLAHHVHHQFLNQLHKHEIKHNFHTFLLFPNYNLEDLSNESFLNAIDMVRLFVKFQQDQVEFLCSYQNV